MLQTTRHVVQLADPGSTLLPFRGGLHRGTGGIGSRLGDIARHHGHAGDEYVVAHFDVANHAHAAGDHAVAADLGTAGNTHAACHGRVVTDLHVVRDHDLVIQLHAVADQGIGESTTVDGGVGADFDIVAQGHATDLCNFLPDTLFVGKAETLAADHGARLDHHALADLHIVIEGHTGSQPATLTDDGAGTDHAVGTQGHASADLRTGLDHHVGANAGAGIDLGIGRDHGSRVNPRLCLGLGIEQVGQLGVGQVGIGHHQGIASKAFGVGCSEQHGGGLGIGKELAVLRVGQEGELTRTGLLQGGQAADSLVLGATQGGAETFGQLAECEDRGRHHQRCWFMRSMTWRVMSYCGLTSTTAPRSSTRS
ncbi:hypothetical protein D9M69_431620 [compost metagenome]